MSKDDLADIADQIDAIKLMAIEREDKELLRCVEELRNDFDKAMEAMWETIHELEEELKEYYPW